MLKQIHSLLILLVAAGCGRMESIEPFTFVAFENSTDSPLVIHLGGNHIKINGNSTGYLPELRDNDSPGIRVFRKVNGLWESAMETKIHTSPGRRDLIQFNLEQNGDLVLHSTFVDKPVEN